IETVPGLIALPSSLSHWFVVIPVGLVAIVVWFFVFRFLILKLGLVTPGREDELELEGEGTAAAVSTASKCEAISDEAVRNIIDGLGGEQNIKKIFCCFTRLRCDLVDVSLIDEDKINKVPNSGIIKDKNNVQIVIGMTVQEVNEAVNKKLGHSID
ncbi:glucose PTS transporter subunit EIIB, partial [Megamonas sp.]|uniref:glucose PTS transporter subunit EIIB n=1 Tax=Megamonas sp. TaxID=2049033 RepID=UPI0025900788